MTLSNKDTDRDLSKRIDELLNYLSYGNLHTPTLKITYLTERVIVKKLKSIWSLIKAKHYAVLVGGSEQDISWAIEALKKANDLAAHKQTKDTKPKKKGLK